ncbi:heavy metal translocating P-type ATPase [Blastopirellula marina]|uniref:P-type Zn(2+) transporter n=1 Tax=Blastopirellula marina TaxID=124 RepID=A0A2S8FMZ9_9BACT|nr:cation-translocating P-type ATPase [Blastopirellula marina]PQO33568.1 heavy metal translocating P-type ATPase [Blastopirellula marina]PTL43355.1 cadmium-translocating P-type ATPase [Blastopirellula marina]
MPESSPNDSPASGTQVCLQVAELDCAEEARILTDGLASQPGIERLDFDVMRGRMDVYYDADKWSVRGLIEAVKSLGMTAHTVLEEAQTETNSPPSQSGIQRERALIRSGAFLLVAVIAQAWEAGTPAAIFGYGDDAHELSFLPMFLYLISIGLGIRWILPKAWKSALRMTADMNVLMTVAVAGAIFLGETFEAAMVTFLFTLSEVLEQRSVARARNSIQSLMSLAPDTARRKTASGDFEEVSTDEIVDGDICAVRPGERVPLDGKVTSGVSAVDQAPITGESVPVEKEPGDPVYAGTINGSGSLEFRVEGTAGSTLLDRIVRLIDQAYQRRAPSEQWVDQFARYYTPTMMLLAVAVMLIPPTFQGWSVETGGEWFYNGLVLLVIACPCALVISTPVSIVSALTAAARNGVLVKGGLSLETLAKVNAIVLDKTGTLTTGTPSVTKVTSFNEMSEEEALAIAASLQQHSTHPIARAILRYANQSQTNGVEASEVNEIPGRGITGNVNGDEVWLGSVRLAQEQGISDQQLSEAAANVVILGRGDTLLATLRLEDQLRDTAVHAVQRLHQLGVKQVELISGDRTEVVQQVAEEVGVDAWKAEQLPEDKIEAVTRLRDQHQLVAMVGDGINDGPALAAADVGVAMGAVGSDTAIETADVALMSDEIEKLPWLIAHGRRTLWLIQQNIGAALGIKVIFILLAMFGWSNLWLAILADTGVSLAVIANSLRLLRTKSP